MGELVEVQYFCEANNGTFTKDGQTFRKFLKDFYHRGAAPTDYSTSVFEGTYTCVDAKEPFSLDLKQYKSSGELSFNLSNAIIKKGGAPISQMQPQQTPQTMMSQVMGAMGLNSGQSNNSYSSPDEKLIRKAAMMKVPYGEQQGSNIVTALYNGNDSQGCSMVSLQKTVANMPVNVAPKNTYNYKVCGNQIISLGETGMPSVPRNKELNPIIAQVKNQCKAYGVYGSEYQGTVVSCRALDQNHCNLEITIMQNGMMVDKRVENSCK
jgi:hypothetical protein